MKQSRLNPVSVLVRLAMAMVTVTVLSGAAACAKYDAPPDGNIEVILLNDGFTPVENIVVTHGPEQFEVGYLQRGEQAETMMSFDPVNPLQVRYMANGQQHEDSYVLRALREHSGVVQLRFDREGDVNPVERFFID